MPNSALAMNFRYDHTLSPFQNASTYTVWFAFEPQVLLTISLFKTTDEEKKSEGVYGNYTTVLSYENAT